MQLREAQAAHMLRKLPREELPIIAAKALEAGLDSPKLRILAGLPSAELDEAWDCFAGALKELKFSPLEPLEALRVYTRMVSRQILDVAVTPYEGARLISVASMEVLGRNHETDAFIYAEDEYERQPEYFAAEITAEARRWVEG